MLLDGCLELLNVLGPPLTKGGLSLTIPLLPLLGCCVDLIIHEPMSSGANVGSTDRLPATLSLLHLGSLLCIILIWTIKFLGRIGEGLFVHVLGFRWRHRGII